MIHRLRNRIWQWQKKAELPRSAREERKKDWLGLPKSDPGVDTVIDECVAWITCAQDYSASHDGGVARSYSFTNGWATSYPETTGYIVPTLIEHAMLRENPVVRERARRMVEWLVSIQLPDGGFQGGRIDSTPVVPVTFNTGQILLGMAAAVREFDNYREPMCRAADWLIRTQDTDGCWRSQPTPFAKPGEKAYETHVAWGLLEVARVEPQSAYADAAFANVHWALTCQRDNGWVEQCCLTEPERPLTHTLGYFLRGVIEAYRYFQYPELLEAASRTADGLMTCIDHDGGLPGRLYPDWRPAVRWACLTGCAQIAHCWLMLYQYTGDERYRNAGLKTNCFVRRTVAIEGPPGIRGGVKGSFPVDGEYGAYEYLNWAAKFLIDSNMLESQLRAA